MTANKNEQINDSQPKKGINDRDFKGNPWMAIKRNSFQIMTVKKELMTVNEKEFHNNSQWKRNSWQPIKNDQFVTTNRNISPAATKKEPMTAKIRRKKTPDSQLKKGTNSRQLKRNFWQAFKWNYWQPTKHELMTNNKSGNHVKK